MVEDEEITSGKEGYDTHRHTNVICGEDTFSLLHNELELL